MAKMPHYALHDDFRIQFKMKCLNTLIPQAKPGDILVPAFTGEKSEALSWLTRFSQWALQQGMSADHTLEMASSYIQSVVKQEFPSSTWTEFIQRFFKYFQVDGDSLFLQWYWQKAANLRVTWFSYRELKSATHNFSEVKVAGNGKVGVLYQGFVNDDQRVVVKKHKDPQAHTLEEVLYEVFLHRSLPESSHLIKLVGYSSDEQDPLIVYEYVSNGNLEQHLEGLFENRLTLADRLNIATDIADAITLLHYNSKFPIYHRDIKSTNILVDFNRRAKLADFGIAAAVSHEKQRSYCHTKVKGSRGYTDPHYDSTGKLTDTTDVYSFGVILMELVTGLKVGLENRTKTFLPDLVVEMCNLGLVDDIVDSYVWCPCSDERKNPCKQCLKQAVDDVIELAIKCCTPDPMRRPKIDQVADKLRHIQLEQSMRKTKLDHKKDRKERRRDVTMERYSVTCSGDSSVRCFSPLFKMAHNFFRLVASSLRPYALCHKEISTHPEPI